jgi:hypothetical protein
MVEDVVNVDSINSFVVKFEVKEFARFFEFTLVNYTWWIKESVVFVNIRLSNFSAIQRLSRNLLSLEFTLVNYTWWIKESVVFVNIRLSNFSAIQRLSPLPVTVQQIRPMLNIHGF